MRRRATILLTAGLVLVVAVAIGFGLNLGSKSSNPTPTPVPPVSTPTPSGNHHPVRLNPVYAAFVKRMCQAFRYRQAAVLEHNLPYYQYNVEVYWSPFNLSAGSWAPVTVFSQWLAGKNVRCVRLSASDGHRHGVLVTRGWGMYGGWGIIDLDIPPGRTGWRMNDFTFGTRQQVLGAFYGNEHRSVRFTAKL